MRILIIGGGAAGGTAAQFARKTDRKAEIIVVDAEPYGQYSRCGLPYALRGQTSAERLIEFSHEWFEKNRIKAMYGWKAVSVDFNSKAVSLKKGEEIQDMEYDKLIIATGARPWAPPIKGIESEGVFFLRTIDDLKMVSEWVERAEKAVIVGAGLIGLESAESLVKMGKSVYVVEFLPYPLPAMIDEDMASTVKDLLDKNGIVSYLSHEVTEIIGDPVKAVKIRDRDGNEREIEADMVLISTGNSPNTEIFKGIEKGRKGHIRVSERSETSIPDVYAAGDCTEYLDFITGEWVPMGMGTMAVRQGMAAGINAAGGDFEIHRFIGTRTTELFGVEIAAVGPISEALKRKGMDFISARFKGKDLPEYMDYRDMVVKVISDMEGRIMGTQIIGRGAPWRISMFAEAILKRDYVGELSKIETPYAPPIAPTLDPTTIACSMLEMKLKSKKMKGKRE